jgi:hypothetical protein
MTTSSLSGRLHCHLTQILIVRRLQMPPAKLAQIGGLVKKHPYVGIDVRTAKNNYL